MPFSNRFVFLSKASGIFWSYIRIVLNAFKNECLPYFWN